MSSAGFLVFKNLDMLFSRLCVIRRLMLLDVCRKKAELPIRLVFASFELWLNQSQDSDEFFEHEKAFMSEYHNRIKDAMGKIDKVTKSQKSEREPLAPQSAIACVVLRNGLLFTKCLRRGVINDNSFCKRLELNDKQSRPSASTVAGNERSKV